MKRLIDQKLIQWRDSEYRKPLIIRGARQVGKTYSVRYFGTTQFKTFITIDFEKQRSAHALFNVDLDPLKIIMELEAYCNQRIIPGETLLFFDEIQVCPQALLSLRYFYEVIPELHLIAAGSLLEFAMGAVSFPVGRVDFVWLRPMSFLEFLYATGEEILIKHLPHFTHIIIPAESIHQTIIQKLKLYFIIGGMPEAIKRYKETGSLLEVGKVHESLSETFFQSLVQYQKRVDVESLEFILRQIPLNVGNQIKFRNLDPERRVEKTKASLQILQRTLLISLVHAVSATGLPLGADYSVKKFKSIFLDIGFMQYLCGIDPVSILHENNILNLYKGSLAEQFVGQELLVHNKGSENNKLFFWSRSKKSSSSEIDYVVVKENLLYPVEVKSGLGGKLKSMHLFLKEHPKSKTGIVLTSACHPDYARGNLLFLPLYTMFD
ncbi:MAG: ATP-binding protein [Spirochaetales bacterium]|nr:ATP-binding protein [Spirochaetales bacterium]